MRRALSMASALVVCLAMQAMGGVRALPLSQPAGESYSAKEIRELTAADLFKRLGEPEPGRAAFAAMHALIEKAKSSNAAKDEIITLGSQIAVDAAAPEVRRWQALYVLSSTGDARVIAAIARALETDASTTVRGVAACALGALTQEEAAAALKRASETEKSTDVLAWIEKALAGEMRPGAHAAGDGVAIPVVNKASAEAVLAGTHYSVVLVKDFLRMENSGPALKGVEFERYTPLIDEEQLVVARWFDGARDDGTPLAVEVTNVRADAENNLIHTLKLAEFPGGEQALVTITTVVARRERPAPEGAFPIPESNAYPEPVRAYLASTPMVDAEHRSVVRQAKALRNAAGGDALKFAYALADLMRGKSYMQTGQPDPDMPTSAVVLKFGGSCCGSAVCAAAMFRAAGIPAQVTYCPPPSYVHGIVQFYLNGYGWVRMDSTCGTGRMPLVQDEADLALVRLFDAPIGMEKMWHAYAWPYHNNDEDGDYTFRAEGRECATIRFATKDNPSGTDVVGRVSKPFPHLEPGSWSTVLGMEAMPAPADWAAMMKASREGVMQRRVGPLDEVLRLAPALREHTRVAQEFARPGAEAEPAGD